MSTKSKARIARRIGYGREYRLMRQVVEPMLALRQCVLAWDETQYRKSDVLYHYDYVSAYPFILTGPGGYLLSGIQVDTDPRLVPKNPVHY